MADAVDLPEPLTPPDCDLRDLDGFMLNVERLLASELWALATGDEFKAAVALWCRAWKQVPAGSLPDDPRVIAAFAGMTRESLVNRHWQVVMRGFVKCSDGRWYHRTLCEDVLRAWAMKRRRAGERNADADRLKRWRERRGNGHETPDETGDETPVKRVSNAGETPTKRVRQGQGQGQGQSTSLRSGGARDPAGERLPMDWQPTADERVFAQELRLNPDRIAADFRDYWHAKPGKDGRKANWPATWRGWCRREADRRPPDAGSYRPTPVSV